MTTIPATAKRPRTKSPETRREELVDSAQALFLDKGFDDTSVDEIVRKAGVAKGTFYFYFKTKDDVLCALQERFVERFQKRLEDAVKICPPDDWTGQLDAWIKAGIDGYLDDFELHDLVFHEFRSSSRRVQHDNSITLHLATLIEGGAKGSAWDAPNPHLIAVMLFGAFHAAVDDEIISSVSTSRRRLTTEVCRFFRTALGLVKHRGES